MSSSPAQRRPRPNLLTLPAELRFLIYDHAIREEVYHISITPQFYDINETHSTRAILQIHPRIRAEALRLFYTRTHFAITSNSLNWYFDHRTGLAEFFSDIGPEASTYLTHMTLGCEGRCRGASKLICMRSLTLALNPRSLRSVVERLQDFMSTSHWSGSLDQRPERVELRRSLCGNEVEKCAYQTAEWVWFFISLWLHRLQYGDEPAMGAFGLRGKSVLLPLLWEGIATNGESDRIRKEFLGTFLSV